MSAIEQLRAAVPHHAAAAPSVSAWSVGKHLEHCALAAIAIGESLESSTPPPPETPRPLAGRLVLWSGRIPRERAQAPEAAIPQGGGDPDRILELLDRAEAALARASRLDPGTWFRHFALGIYTRDEAIRFVEVHSRHHLRIVGDVFEASGRT